MIDVLSASGTANFSGNFEPGYNGMNGTLTKTGPGMLIISQNGANDNGFSPTVQQGTLVLGNGQHAVSSVAGVSLGATLQMSSTATSGNQFASGVNNMNGTFDLNGRSEGVTALNGSGTVTNNALSTTGTITYGYIPNGHTGNNSGGPAQTFAGTITNGNGVVALSVSGGQDG